jgi:hypothetical protein
LILSAALRLILSVRLLMIKTPFVYFLLSLILNFSQPFLNKILKTKSTCFDRCFFSLNLTA